MSAPKRKPLGQWEPLPYLVVLALAVAISLARPEVAPFAFWPLLVAVTAAAAWLVATLVRDSRSTRNPDRWGDLRTLDGIRVIDAPGLPRAVSGVVPVLDAQRHQSTIDLARIHGGSEQRAVLVPRASRWMSWRYRVGVQLVGGTRPHLAGFLPEVADERWREVLDRLRGHGAYVRVPATIVGAERPFRVELDLSGLEAVAAEEG
ncbi:hypothetical protein [Agromyces mangrovi Wang et al. 2018]|uniref:hypothetical protein n=1 Tax=Agromyces mangrovi TaxID=1858653 RepID=UPI002573A659|nr:hypothetical protein [Agromyces mangrovi]BDZ66032.1 hypothetical protein GCM10025877_29700 [Agromyces mangrovi]